MITRETSETSQPVGLLILGRKRPGFDQEWNQIICQRSVAAMESLGFRCIGQDAPVVDDATLRGAVDAIRDGGCDSLVLLQPSLGNGQLSLRLAQLWPGPIVLWATPERPGDGKVSSCSLVGQHMWASIFRQAGHAFELVCGDPDDATTRGELSRGVALSRATMGLRNAKVGVVGTHAPGFIDLAADPFLLQRSFGVQLHSLSLVQFIGRVRKIDEDAALEDVNRVRGIGLPMVSVEEADLEVSSRCYLAMRELIKEESLDALSIQCWPELPDVLGQWPYLAISRLTAEGRAVSMEGDVDACVASVLGIKLGLGPGFLTDWLEHDRSTIFLWHGGMAPLDMCNAVGTSEGPALGKHFNLVKPLVLDGPLQAGRSATVMRLWHRDNEYVMTAFEGRTIRPRRKLSGNTALVEIEGRDVGELFDALIHEGMPHHVHLYYGHCCETFRRLARLLHVRWVG